MKSNIESMLKHCSNLDLRGSHKNISEKKISTDKLKGLEQTKCGGVNDIKSRDLSERRLSVSSICMGRGKVGLREPCYTPPCNRRHRKLHKQSQSHILDEDVTLACTESIRVYASCLRSDIEYRTVRISKMTTASQVIAGLLNKFKLRHVDNNLFYLTLDVTLEEGKTAVIKMSDSDKLFEMVKCSPWRNSCVRLCSKPGKFLRIYDGVLMPDSVYKSIRISSETTVRDVIDIVLSCCNSSMKQDQICLVQAEQDTLNQTTGLVVIRALESTEFPLRVA